MAEWLLLGGGALLIVGGAAFAMARRPKRVRVDDRNAIVTHVEPAVVEPAGVTRSSPQALVPADEDVAIARDDAPAQVRCEPTAAVASQRQFQQTSGRSAQRDATGDVDHDRLETLAAQAPSEANPFVTRKPRLRRANFLLRTGQIREEDVAVGSPDTATPARTDRWSEMRFNAPIKTRVSWSPKRSQS